MLYLNVILVVAVCRPSVLWAVMAGQLLCSQPPACRWPVDCRPDSIRLTDIGAFGLWRKARPGIPAHFHAGVDIVRPSKNYDDEPIYPVSCGRVVSLRDDGPYSQLIIENVTESGDTLWSVYEHIAGISSRMGDSVSPSRPIARFMNRRELSRYGWQFDHLHLEIMKVRPRKNNSPQRRSQLLTYGLTCYSREELESRYIDPLEFISARYSNDSLRLYEDQ
jgi:murein DD-endopeptidase MepM/ murein hydrolase activator NlpD